MNNNGFDMEAMFEWKDHVFRGVISRGNIVEDLIFCGDIIRALAEDIEHLTLPQVMNFALKASNLDDDDNYSSAKGALFMAELDETLKTNRAQREEQSDD